MGTGLTATLNGVRESLPAFIPELLLGGGIVVLLVGGMIFRKHDRPAFFHSTALLFFLACIFVVLSTLQAEPVALFGNMIRSDRFSSYLKILVDTSAILTVFMSWRNQLDKKYLSEYYALIFAVVLGAHLLVMSVNFIMVFLSLELISIPSYVLAGFLFSKKGAEASLKYFLYGSVMSAIMLYGLSILYGMAGTLAFTSQDFLHQLGNKSTSLMFTATLMMLGGFFYKMAAVPMHPWAPDVYEGSSMPVVAFFSVVPKLAGLGVLARTLMAVTIFGHLYDWPIIVGIVAALSLTVGNFSALRQKNPKRMMAYSSIAQSGFLLIALATGAAQGIQVTLFYAAVYMVSNYLVFVCLNYFERLSITSVESFAGAGRDHVIPSVFIFIGFISLTGLPPTGGFAGKLFLFSSLWDGYAQSGKILLLGLLLYGLLNTVVALFYYVRIPYFAFLKAGQSLPKANNFTFENLLGLILVMLILVLFFLPGLLMGWINKINFVL